MPIFHIFKTDISSFEWEGGHLNIINRYLHSGIQGRVYNVNIVDKTCINAKHKEVIVLPFYAVCRSAIPLQLRGILTFLLRSGKITARWPENLMWNGEKCKQQIGNSTLRFWEIRRNNGLRMINWTLPLPNCGQLLWCYVYKMWLMSEKSVMNYQQQKSDVFLSVTFKSMEDSRD